MGGPCPRPRQHGHVVPRVLALRTEPHPAGRSCIRWAGEQPCGHGGGQDTLPRGRRGRDGSGVAAACIEGCVAGTRRPGDRPASAAANQPSPIRSRTRRTAMELIGTCECMGCTVEAYFPEPGAEDIWTIWVMME